MKKHMLPLLLAAFFALSLAACNTQETDSSSQLESGQESSQLSSAPSPSPSQVEAPSSGPDAREGDSQLSAPYFPPAVSTSYIPSAHFLFHSLMTSFSDLCPRCDCPSAVSIRSTWYCEPLSRSSSEALFTLVHFPLLSMLAALFAMRSILSNS